MPSPCYCCRGGCCCCEEESTSEERRGLIQNGSGTVVVSQPVGCFRRLQSNTKSKPLEINSVARTITVAPTTVKEVDKLISECSDLYNEHYSRYYRLEDFIFKFKNLVQHDDKTIQNSVLLLCNNEINLTIERTKKFYIEIKRKEHAVLSDDEEKHLALYLTIMNRIDQITQHSYEIRLMLDNCMRKQKRMKRAVLSASLGADSDTYVINCINDFDELGQAVDMVEKIEKQTMNYFTLFLEALLPIMDIILVRERMERMRADQYRAEDASHNAPLPSTSQSVYSTSQPAIIQVHQSNM